MSTSPAARALAEIGIIRKFGFAVLLDTDGRAADEVAVVGAGTVPAVVRSADGDVADIDRLADAEDVDGLAEAARSAAG